MSACVLAGDIGGTKTRLATYRREPVGLVRLYDRTYASAEYGSFDALIAHFLEECDTEVAAACFGVAGPVRDGRCRATNLPWVLDERDLTEALGIPRVTLLNDLVATSYGLLRLPSEELVELNPNAQSATGNIAVLAAGTGLGECLLYWDGQTHLPIATESGHADFAPNTARQDELLRYLRERFGGHVSYERVLSGPGLFDIYRFLRASGDVPESPTLAEALRAGGDPGRLIGEHGMGEGDALSRQALHLFAEVYGAEAGNWALRSLAHGGVLLGGGIAAKILPILREGGFLQAFCDKGRFSGFLRSLSVKVALNPDAGLLGAAHHAVETLA
jgi:glucokinase